MASCSADDRFIGDARFTAGIGIQMLLKKGYTCSVATYGHLVEPDTTKTEVERREEIKEHVVDHYNKKYLHSGQTPQSEIQQGDLRELVGTKRPMDQWEHKTYDSLFSFYAGKVCTFVSTLLLMIASVDIENCSSFPCGFVK